MSITSKDETITEDGQQKPAFTVTFSNGAKEQLEELQKFTKSDNLLEVVKIAISILQRAKEISDEKK